MPVSIFQEFISLNSFSTIRLGGDARFFTRIDSEQKLRIALEEAIRPPFILGGGSNCVFPDKGLDACVMKMEISDISFLDSGNAQTTLLRVGAGIEWDHLVSFCIKHQLGGIEALSGIPGTVGAAPVQNIGAYGQEISSCIYEVHGIELETKRKVTFNKEECDFSYRNSRFKKDKNKVVILYVDFIFSKNYKIIIKYPQLAETIKQEFITLEGIREAVLKIRKEKSMVIDESDMHSRSVGSFFTNPILNKNEWENIQKVSTSKELPVYRIDAGNYKVPAAWLIEQSGYRKGSKYKQVGISLNHSLALVNYGGTTTQLLELASDIQKKVANKFDIILEYEPITQFNCI